MRKVVVLVEKCTVEENGQTDMLMLPEDRLCSIWEIMWLKRKKGSASVEI